MDKLKVVCPHCGKTNALPKKEHYVKAVCGGCKRSLLETKPVSLDAAGFYNHVANNDIPLVVDFWAPWCGPCKTMAPSFKRAAASFALKARFAKVNAQEQQSLAARFSIRSIPTIIAFKGSREIGRISGALSDEQVVSWVSRFV